MRGGFKTQTVPAVTNTPEVRAHDAETRAARAEAHRRWVRAHPEEVRREVYEREEEPEAPAPFVAVALVYVDAA